MEGLTAPAVSILIAAFNAAEFIERALNSASRQTFEDLEIICVDDGSTDDTAAIISSHAAGNPRIKLIRQKNAGAAAARYSGLKNSAGRYICSLDSDDELDADAIEKAYRSAEQHRSDLVLFQLCRRYQDRPDRYMDLSRIKWPLAGSDAFGLTIGHWRIHALGLYRRSIFEKAYEAFELKSYNADEIITRRAFLASKEITYCATTYYYNIHSNSTCRRMSNRWEQSLQTQLEVIRIARETGLYEKFKKKFDAENFRLCVKARENTQAEGESLVVNKKIEELAGFISRAYVLMTLAFARKWKYRKFAAHLLFHRNLTNPFMIW